MIAAVIGSRKCRVDNLGRYLPQGVDEIVSGGAAGIDTCAAAYARAHRLPLKVFLPEYEKYGRSAPIRRNIQIVNYADCVLAFWDGSSRGTKFVIDYCKRTGKPCSVVMCTPVWPE